VWALQSIFLFFKLISSKHEILNPHLFASFPMEYKDAVHSGWFFMAKKTIFVSGFHGVSWWLIFIPAYLIVIKYLLNRWLAKETRI